MPRPSERDAGQEVAVGVGVLLPGHRRGDLPRHGGVLNETVAGQLDHESLRGVIDRMLDACPVEKPLTEAAGNRGPMLER